MKLWFLSLAVLCVLGHTVYGMKRTRHEFLVHNFASSGIQSDNKNGNMALLQSLPREIMDYTSKHLLVDVIEDSIRKGTYHTIRSNATRVRLVSKYLYDVTSALIDHLRCPGNMEQLMAEKKYQNPDLFISVRSLDYWLLAPEDRKAKWEQEALRDLTEQQQELVQTMYEGIRAGIVQHPSWVELQKKIADIKNYGDWLISAYEYICHTAHQENSAICKPLIEAGADVNMQDEEGWTMLMGAVIEGRANKANLLLKFGANPNARDTFGKNALMYASTEGYEEIVEQLLQAGACLNAQDNKGRTAFMYAVKCHNEAVVEQLLKAGANAQLQDNDKKIAKNFAKKPEIKQLIKEYSNIS